MTNSPAKQIAELKSELEIARWGNGVLRDKVDEYEALLKEAAKVIEAMIPTIKKETQEVRIALSNSRIEQDYLSAKQTLQKLKDAGVV